jgi:phosphoesterase RecJ-like protein
MRNNNKITQTTDTVLSKIIDIIQKNKNFLVTAHDNLDGDGFGSGLALCFALEQLGKKAKFLLKTPIPTRYKFLPGVEKFTAENINLKNYDTLVSLDTAGWDQLEQLSPEMFSDYTIVNIDHHVDNTKFGSINWIETKASAVGEQIYVLLRDLKIQITADIATCLYTSILTDTGCFQFTNTTSETHLIIGDLIRSGISPAVIYEQIYERMSLTRLNLLKLALSTVKTDSKGQIIWMWITQKMFSDTGTNRADTEGFIDYIKAVDGVKVAFVLKESNTKGEIRVTFRSRVPSIQVNLIAHRFDGGGHPAASGCTIKGTNEEVEKRVVETVKNEIKSQTANHKAK